MVTFLRTSLFRCACFIIAKLSQHYLGVISSGIVHKILGPAIECGPGHNNICPHKIVGVDYSPGELGLCLENSMLDDLFCYC